MATRIITISAIIASYIYWVAFIASDYLVEFRRSEIYRYTPDTGVRTATAYYNAHGLA